MIGEIVSHYKILEKLGEGGMGIVYKAQDTKLDRLVALKFLPRELTSAGADGDSPKNRFTHEARAAAALDHPNICAVFEIDETEDGQMFIAMAYYQGQTLKEKISGVGENGGSPLPLTEAIDIAIQVAEGLHEAHEKKIIHRDIKSANILITDKGVVKILDFGLAKLRGQTKLTKEGTTLGTVAYMSPEQTTGVGAGHRSDIWSLGVVLYEMITGQLPFKGAYDQAIMYAIMNEEPEPVTGLRTGVPMELERIINKALAKSAGERYQTTADLIVDLKKARRDSKPDVKEPSTAKEITVTFGLKKWFVPALVAIALVVIGLVVWSPRAKEEMAPVPSDNPSLAVMYFKNLTGDENLDNWETGISYSIITDLSQSKYIKVLSTDKLFSISKKLDLLNTTDYATEDLKAVAAEGEVNHIILGRLLKSGEIFRIEYTLQDILRGKNIGSGRVEGRGEESIFVMVDGLTRLIKADFMLSKETIAGDIDREVGEITTSSPEAFTYYIEGRKYSNQGNHRKSIELMEKAISIDPGFAMAYRSISQSHWSLYNTAKSNEYMKKAFELADRLPERELYLIRGSYYARSEKTYDRAIDAYNKSLALYPGDLELLANLGMVYHRSEDFDTAIELFGRCVQLKAKHFSPHAWLAIAYWNKGFFDKAEQVIEDYIINFTDKALVRHYLALTYFHQGKFDLALTEADKSLSFDPAYPRAFWLKGNIYLGQGDLDRAEKEYQTLLAHEEQSFQFGAMGLLANLNSFRGRFEESKDLQKTQINLAEKMGDLGKIRGGHLALSYFYRKSGRYEDALKECKKAWIGAVEEDDIRDQRDTLYEQAQVYIGKKSITKARQTAEALKAMIDKGIILRNHIRMYYHLMGKIELKQGAYDNAIDHFKKMTPLLHEISNWHVTLADSLGSAYYRAGNLEKAQEEYEKLTTSAPGRFFYGDIYARALHQLGKIYEQRGFKGKAIDSYNKFIDLWKNCDPQFRPIVEDARKRVIELRAGKMRMLGLEPRDKK